jgi:hypothetical protein
LILAVGISVAGAVALLALVCGCYWPRRSSVPQYAPDLAAPLPAEAQAELAASLDTIDEFRHHNGSVLTGTLLESVAEPEAPHDNSYIDLLRREARRLDDQAADREDIGHYVDADRLRRQAEQLRQQARDLSQPLINFGSPTVNR